MTWTDFVYKLGFGILWTTDVVFENVGNIFNYAVLILGFVGLFLWLYHQNKMNKQAANDPDQIK